MNEREERAPAREEQAERLALLNEISRVMTSALDLRTLYNTIFEQIGRVMDTSQFYVALHGTQHVDVPFLYEEGHGLFDEHVEYGNNITSYAVEHGITLLYHTTQECQEWERAHGLEELIIGDEDSQSGIFVPLALGNRCLGTLSVQSQRRHAYTDEDVRTLAVIAAQAAIAIENARLFSASQDSVRRMQTLLDVARTVRGSLDLPAVLDAILTSIRTVLPYYLAEISLPDAGRGHFDVVGSTGYRAEDRRATLKIPIDGGLTGRVFASGEPLVVPDVRVVPEYIGESSEGARSALTVPLRRGDKTIGVLNVEREEVNGFSEQDVQTLSLFASQAAIAIENARLFSEQQQRVSELQTIQSLVQQLTPLHEVPQIADLIQGELGKLIDFHACRLFVYDHPSGFLLPIVEGQSEVRLRLGEGITGWIAEHGEAVVIDNTLTDERSVHIAGTPVRPESMIGAPLIYEGKVRGVITLSKHGIGKFDGNALRLLEIVAAQAAIAFDRARLYEELRAEAITDPLTGLYNRRYLQERLTEERSRAVRNHHPLVAIMLDIDKFKRVNDAFGHTAGDVVLVELAHVIRGVVRAEDVVARFGGEEFCVLLPEIPLADAERVAERLRNTIAEHLLPEGAGVQRVTVSVGIALLEEGDVEGTLVARADRAMYHAKHAGGNSTSTLENEYLRPVDRPRA